MSGSRKQSMFSRLANAVGNVASDHLTRLPARVRDHLKVDIANKRFFLSHKMFAASVRAAADLTGKFKIAELRPLADAYKLVAQVGGRDVVTRFRIESVTWSEGQVVVRLSVPEGVEITSSPVMNFIAAGVCRIFGGTFIGESILSSPLPPNMRWDGRTAWWTSQISSTHDLPEWLTAAEPLVLTVDHEAEGIRFTVDADTRTLLWLVPLVGKQLAKLSGDE